MRPAILTSAVVVVASILPAVGEPAAAQDSPARLYEEGRRAYQQGDYTRAIRVLRPLLYPSIALSSEAQVLDAHRILAISHLFRGERDASEREFAALLALAPDYQLDPLVDPDAAVELLETVRSRNAERLEEIEEEIKEERERQRLEALRKRQKADEAAARDSRCVERTEVIKRHYWVNFVPFGAGQFQNGHRLKGYILMGLQGSLGAASLSTALWHRISYSQRLAAGRKEAVTARRLAITQVVTGGLFFAAVAYGVADALIHYQPQDVVRRVSAPRVSVSPWFSGDGGYLALHGVY